SAVPGQARGPAVARAGANGAGARVGGGCAGGHGRWRRASDPRRPALGRWRRCGRAQPAPACPKGGMKVMEDATHVSFSDVVRAHYAWDKQNGEHSRAAYDDTIERFQRDEGEIVDAYWCRKDASAVALTRKRITRGRLALGERQADEYRLCRVSDWVTGGGSEIANLLHECDVLAIKAAKGLEGIQQGVGMQGLRW